MARVRKIILSIASGSVLYSGMAPAVGLGDITINSALNQPLEAEIELLQVGDLTEQEMRIALASPDAFMRAGVDRPLFLDDLRFTTLLRGSRSIVRVVSSKPIREPYLNFVVEMTRPTGRLLREYTLLIDPPGALAERPQAAGFQRNSEAPAVRMQLPAVTAAPLATQGATYEVVRGDSLWKIARRLQAAGSQAALAQLMADIHALNPQAFVGGDIDRLIVGASLLLPDRANQPGSRLESVAESAAPAEPAVPVPAVVAGTIAAAPAEQQAVAKAEVAGLQRQLDAVLAGQAQERLRLQQQMSELESQLAGLREQVASKDLQVEALQSRIGQLPATLVESAPLAPLPPTVPLAVTPDNAADAPLGGFSGWLLGLVGGALLAAIAGGLFWWRRRAPDAESEPERIFADYQNTRPAASGAAVRVRAEQAVEPLGASAGGAAADAAPAGSAVEPDALDGANIYLAYGRLDEAREVLQRTLEEQPARNDIRLRLLDLLAKMGDGAAFAVQAQLLTANPANLAQLERIKAAHPELTSTRPEDPLQAVRLDLDDPLLPQARNELLEDAPLNLDAQALDLDAEWDLITPFDQAEAARPVLLDEGILSGGKLELPEVNEISGDAEAMLPFANLQSASTPVEAAPADDTRDPFGEDHRHLGRNLDHLASHPQSLARLNMALAYIDQGDLQSACDILNQLISEGDDQQRQVARAILARIA